MQYKDLEQEVRDFNPDWVGISAITFESNGVHRVASIVKNIRRDLPVIVGGPHASSYTSRVMDDPHIDFAVIGEGELTVDDLNRSLRMGTSVNQIDGLAWREKGRVCINERRRYVQHLDNLPFPAWDLIDVPLYRKFHRMSRIGTQNYMGLFTSRACPFACLYCHKLFGKRFRKRSPENVMAEIETLYAKYNVKEFEIIDDCFNLDLSRAKRIFEMIIKSRMKLRLMFPNGIRGEYLDEEFMVKGKQAGLTYMSFAIETATPRLQKMLRKNINFDKIEKNIALARKHHIICLGFFMLGFPTETREELEATINYAVQSQLHAANFFAVSPFEGTELAELAKQLGKPVFDKFEHDYLSDDCTNLTDLSDDELKWIRQKALVRFWSKPSRIWAFARDYPDKRRFPYLVKALIERILLK
jgi:radical SAM superfamily enzyme YgiQ (UPF0313 family)